MDDEWVAREIKAHGLDLLRSPKAKEDGGGGRGEKTKKPPEAELKMKIQTSKMRIQIANMKIQISTARKREKLKLVDAKILELQRQLDAIEANRSNDKMNELEKQLHAINDCLALNGLVGLHQPAKRRPSKPVAFSPSVDAPHGGSKNPDEDPGQIRKFSVAELNHEM